jgi:hypothetical protein
LTINSRPVEAVPGDHEGPLGICGGRRRRKGGIVLAVIGGERPSSSLPRRVKARSAFTGGGKFSVIR